jgi:acyl-CoA reductase-like NAD-dependent aldehyde dehydrogenase
MIEERAGAFAKRSLKTSVKLRKQDRHGHRSRRFSCGRIGLYERTKRTDKGSKISIPTSPFGGYKESGFGREGGLHGLLPYISLN